MRARTLLALGIGAVSMVVSAEAWLACGGGGTPGDTSSSVEGGLRDATGERADSNAVPDAGRDVDAGFPDADGAGEAAADAGAASNDASDAAGVDCIDYCALMEQTCTGASAQYAQLDAGGHAQCLNGCYLIPLGTKSDTSGNTVGCRVYEANMAQSTGMLDPYCWYAGPFGYGPCGDPCTDFCALTVAWCSPDAGYMGPPPYANADDCHTACATYRRVDSSDGGLVFVDGGFVGSGSIGNTLDCRESFLESAMSSAAAREVHCPHTAYAQLADAAPGFPCTGP